MSNPSALIVGRGAESAQAALRLAQAGVGVTLPTGSDWLTPDSPAGVPTMLEAARHRRVRLLTGANIETVQSDESTLARPRLSSAEASVEPGLRVTVQQSPRYVDPALCTACGACVEVCPVLLPGENGSAAHKVIYRGGVPTTYAIDKVGTAPCRDACPIDQRAQGYVALIRAGDYAQAMLAI